LSILSAERHPRENRDIETSLNLGKLAIILRGVREDQINSGMLTFRDFSHQFDCIPHHFVANVATSRRRSND
jgi:hypothetical protein